MTGNQPRELGRKRTRSFLGGPTVASWFLAARHALPAGEKARPRDFVLPQGMGNPVDAKI
jgi:hypothetical protein